MGIATLESYLKTYEGGYVMILVLNCNVNDQHASDFDEVISENINKLDLPFDIKRISQNQDIEDLFQYTHLIISGSEASALDDNPWDNSLSEIILHFINHKKAVLGICYGHQFLARTLIGKQCLRKAQKAEIGWLRIDIRDNKLFDNIYKPVSFVLHYDEVSCLTEDFSIIASSKDCAIHGYQYKHFPIWGIQFHPEFNYAKSKQIFEAFSQIEANFHEYFINDLDEESRLLQNDLFIHNFLKYKI